MPFASTRRAFRPLAFASVLGAVATGSFGSLGCTALEPPPELAREADVTFRGLSLEHARNGRVVARARLAELRYERDAAHATGDRLRYVPLANGRESGRLEAAKLDGQISRGLVDLGGGVTWSAKAGERATTESCRIDLGANEAVGDRPVTVESPGLRMEGQRFRYALGEPGSDDPDDGARLLLEGGVKVLADPPRPAPVAKKSRRPKR